MLLHSDKGTVTFIGRAYSIELSFYDDKIEIKKKLKIIGGGFNGIIGIAARAAAKAAGKGEDLIILKYSDVVEVKEKRVGLRKGLRFVFKKPGEDKTEKWDILGLKNREKIIQIIKNKRGY